MLRTILLGVLTVTSVVGCKSEGGTSAKAEPGVAAGKVVEVKGTVTVKHGDASRPLAAGESVEGDDVVTTGADGNVVIELSHNLVRWELGPNKTQKVRESIAFKAAKNTGPTANVEQDTAAAGRPAERSAVGTTATEVEEPAASADQAAPAAAPAPPAAEPSAPAPERKRTTRTRREVAKKEAMPEIPSAEAAMAPRDDAPPPQTLRATRGATRGGAVIAPQSPQLESAKSASASGGGTANTSSAAAALVSQKQSSLKACLQGHADPVSLLVTISGGKASVKLTSKTAVSAALDACVKKVIGSISFSGDGKVSTSIKP
jgi:hypothetical protein